MPYNTRRKSLSLPSLGIHVPVTHAARAAANRAPPNQPSSSQSHNHTSRGASPTASPSAATASAGASPSTHRHPTPTSGDSSASAAASPKHSSSSDASSHHHPNKRTKRSHASGAHSSSISSTTKLFASTKPAATTPPPSPKPSRQASVEMDDAASSANTEIDMDAVNDDIVEAVILHLQSTHNRPHLIKELSAILMQQLKSVQQSANPCAIISSRLASYMKRPCWSASSSCPLTKELETIHPRRTYYYLTTCPHLPLPDPSSSHFIVPRTSIVTPPLSSAPSGSEAAEEERRRELSPSPEVDLSAPEFDDADDDVPMPGTPIGSFSTRFPRPPSVYVSRNHRGASPPLEKDEKEFTQTAEGLQKQKLAGHTFLLLSAPSSALASPSSAGPHAHGHGIDLDDAGREESLLFGSESRHLVVNAPNAFNLLTSPAMRPMFGLGFKKEADSDGWSKLDNMLDWDRSPENVELEELDGLLDDF